MYFEKEYKMILIILSTYNGSQYLPEFLASLEAQTYQDWNLIIRDDGSKDSTLSILREFQQHYPDRVDILQDGMNVGAKVSFGKLIESALENPEWKYLMFADQDDVWMSDKIVLTRSKMKSMAKKFANDVPLLVHTDLSVTDEKLHILAQSMWSYQNINPHLDTFNFFITQNRITGCTMMINRPLAQLAVPVPNEAIMHDWWISLIASAFGHIGIVSQPTILYRQHGSNDTGAKKFGYKHIFNQFRSRPRLDKYFIQAKAFFNVHGEQLNTSQQMMLKDLAEWENTGFCKRRWLIIRYRLWKKGVIRNIGLMVFA